MSKPLCEMTEPELAATMRRAADAVKAALPPGTLFALLAFDDPGVAQYIANCERRDVIRAMRECADRMEGRETIERVGFEWPEG
jgi:hypothetical protein